MNALVIADQKPTRAVIDLISEQPVDIIITLGDLELHDIRGLQSITEIPKIGVYGNHCSGTYFEILGITNMHLRTWEFGGITFGGFEGSLRYKPSSVAKMYTHEESVQLLQDFPYVDVMISHSPPQGINDEPGSHSHEGLLGLRQYVDNTKPRYFLHGHTYPSENEVVAEHGSTKIIYVHQEKLVTLE